MLIKRNLFLYAMAWSIFTPITVVGVLAEPAPQKETSAEPTDDNSCLEVIQKNVKGITLSLVEGDILIDCYKDLYMNGGADGFVAYLPPVGLGSAAEVYRDEAEIELLN